MTDWVVNGKYDVAAIPLEVPLDVLPPVIQIPKQQGSLEGVGINLCNGCCHLGGSV